MSSEAQKERRSAAHQQIIDAATKELREKLKESRRHNAELVEEAYWTSPDGEKELWRERWEYSDGVAGLHQSGDVADWEWLGENKWLETWWSWWTSQQAPVMDAPDCEAVLPVEGMVIQSCTMMGEQHCVIRFEDTEGHKDRYLRFVSHGLPLRLGFVLTDENYPIEHTNLPKGEDITK